jgi:hypothetical protein
MAIEQMKKNRRVMVFGTHPVSIRLVQSQENSSAVRRFPQRSATLHRNVSMSEPRMLRFPFQ